MSDTKEGAGWATPSDGATINEASTPGWDVANAKKLAEFEQSSRARSAVERGQRNDRAERVEVFEERDVTDPSRVYTPTEQSRDQGAAERDGEGWTAQEGDIEAAELDAADVQAEGRTDLEQAEEVERADPAAFNDALEAARAEIEAAFPAAQTIEQDITPPPADPRSAARAGIEAAFGHDDDQELER